MTKDELTNKFIELNEKSVKYMGQVSNVLYQLNDNNKLHRQAIDVNTVATKDMASSTKEMTKSFNKVWIILWVIILALIVLAGAEKVLNFLPKFP
jgi:hypothetical protein